MQPTKTHSKSPRPQMESVWPFGEWGVSLTRPMLESNRQFRSLSYTPYAGFCLVVSRSCSGKLQTQKLMSHLLSTQSLKVLPLNPGVGQYIAIHVTPTARDFFLADYYPSGPLTCIFPKPLPSFSCVGCGKHRFLCGPAE